MIFQKPEELWITNISTKKDISISDLRITIRRGQSINLFGKTKNGKKCYNLTKEQIEKSILSGSIFTKRNFIKIRNVAPVVFTNKIDTADFMDRSLTLLNRKSEPIENIDYPDLDFDAESSEEFAEQNAEFEFIDRAPVLAVDPKFNSHDDE